MDVKKRITEEKINVFLPESEAGLAVAELCRRRGLLETCDYLVRNKFGGMNVSDAKHLKEVETVAFCHVKHTSGSFYAKLPRGNRRSISNSVYWRTICVASPASKN
uniref:Insertion element IS407 uncharacterized 10.0 kDa protein n=1 Tax=Curvibacter symbiont subsp. Hydra magnipapillata TaxID=667019 RepID=C9Y6T6_CURXX|nr:Insertion element IS407 uncharacterized 10.0 kDa protein [Curvibacter putative symbiont of Hydra magnipapillata]